MKEEGGVDRGQLGPRGAPPGLHVEEVVVETFVAGGVGLPALGAAPEEAQGDEGAADGLGARQEAALHSHRVGAEGHSHGGDAGRTALRGLVAHETIAAIGLVQEVREALPLELVEDPVPPARGWGPGRGRHGTEDRDG